MTFSELGLSTETMKGLKAAHYNVLTPIQQAALPIALKGRDVLGAARTGSGKTLAFLIPLLELLHSQNWGAMDGLGALILCPTRELAIQIFGVLKKIGVQHHNLSAGLLIGGKSIKHEQDRLNKMNILVCTPGRLLQHCDQTFGFQMDNIKMLVLDEADRILDMGFRPTVNAILENLPKDRQTLLFSATQTASVSALAKLSLTDPAYIAVDAEETVVASSSKNEPAPQLRHFYTIVPLEKKLDALWGFLRTHTKAKIVVFFSSTKQVRHAYTTFAKMQPGLSLIHLHGRMKQLTRYATYKRFIGAPKSCCLFATDVAARGLDFPSIDWVIQVDAPEDAETYVHRVGRTARYKSQGNGLLLLLPSELAFVDHLTAKKIAIDKIKIKETRMTLELKNQMQSLAFQDAHIKYLAQRAFISYVKSVAIQKHKDVFKLEEMDLNEYAISLGLTSTPQVTFLKQDGLASSSKRHSEAANPYGHHADAQDMIDDDGVKAPKKTKAERMLTKVNQDVLSRQYQQHLESDEDASENDLLTLQRRDHALDSDEGEEYDKAKQSKRQAKIAASRKATAKRQEKGKKIIFDEEGTAQTPYLTRRIENENIDALLDEAQDWRAQEIARMKEADQQDRELAKEKKRYKKRKAKARERAELGLDEEAQPLPTFEGGEDSDYESPNWSDALDELEKTQEAAKKAKRSIEIDEARAMALLGMT